MPCKGDTRLARSNIRPCNSKKYDDKRNKCGGLNISVNREGRCTNLCTAPPLFSHIGNFTCQCGGSVLPRTSKHHRQSAQGPQYPALADQTVHEPVGVMPRPGQQLY